MDPAMWGGMTLAEFMDAIEGFNELEEERLRWHFFTTRKICWWVVAAQGSGKEVTEEEILPIKELDEQLEKMRRENLPLAKVEIDGPEQ